MKKPAGILVLLLLSVFCQAQKIRFTDTSNKWIIATPIDDLPGSPFTFHTEEYNDDTTINGYSYVQIKGTAWVREDTISKRIYVLGGYPCDSFEHLLYDYNLAVGDTFWSYQCQDTVGDVVDDIDSVLILGVWHKKFHFTCFYNCGFTPDFTVIEGVGCLLVPTFPRFAVAEMIGHLVCFFNKGIKPIVLSSYSCVLPVETVNRYEQKATVFPNPLTVQSRITLPYRFPSGVLTIYDSGGRTIRKTEFRQQSELPVGNLELPPGMYLFQVWDYSNGKTLSGKFAN